VRITDTAVSYARFSTDRQDARSIDDQLRRCRAFAKTRSLHVADEFSDAAVSGTHTERGQLQRLLADAARKRFRYVLVDDLSRLSRDLGDVWQMVFGTFAALDIVLIDCMTGMASDSPGARMTFGAMGLVSDGFIQMIRAETHRGLEGRILSGHWTGGRVFGYGTEPEQNPPDPANVRMVPVVDNAEAAIVVRIFRDFAAGQSLQAIADALNREGVAAPHDGGKGNKNVRGWGHGTIRAMLRNRRYQGRLIWNQSKWVRVPGRKGRRRIMRPQSEWIVREAPDLRVVPPQLWADVQARIRREPRGRGAKAGVGKRQGSILSGLMKCGTCGGAFNIVGRRTKAGKLYTSLGCSVSRSRGESICANRRTLDERKLLEHVRAELGALASHPEALKVFADAYQQRITERQRDANTSGLEKELRKTRRLLANAADLVVEMPRSQSIREKHAELESAAQSLEGKIAAAREHVVVPHPARIAAELRDLLGLMTKDVPRARQALAKLMPQPFRMVPEADGYRVEGGLQLGLTAPEGAASRPAVLTRLSSGGVL
jgi:site-specific DNA recombinase